MFVFEKWLHLEIFQILKIVKILEKSLFKTNLNIVLVFKNIQIF
jgi:hypothetical protein